MIKREGRVSTHRAGYNAMLILPMALMIDRLLFREDNYH
jgi:hypothetical protein